MRGSIMTALVAAAGFACTAGAQTIFPEVEPNDSKATANLFTLAPLDGVSGNSLASTGVGLDYFRIRTSAAPLGIYRYRMVLTTPGTAGHVGTIRGTNQVAAALGPWPGPVGTAGTTDAAAQTSSTTTTPPRFVQWYGFGRQEELYYRVTGTASTTANYTSVLEREAVIPTPVSPTAFFNSGSISISTFGQGHTSDTDLWVYDANLNAMAGYGNDDEDPVGGSPGTGASLQSFLRRDFAPGTYYIALTNFNLANNQGSPSDDGFRTGTMLDFPDAVLNSSTTVNINMAFTISDGVTSVQVANTKLGAYDVNWFEFRVIPTPGSLALLGMGGLALVRRRR